MKDTASEVLDAAEAQLVNPRSRAVRTAGCTGAADAARTAAGLAQKYVKRHVSPLHHIIRQPQDEVNADAKKCPRCRQMTTTAKLADGREVDYCGACRFPIPLPEQG